MGLGGLVLAQIGYPLTHGTVRVAFVLGTVSLGFLLSVAHAALTGGIRTTAAVVLVTTVGGLGVEALGVATGFPFGRYAYGTALGPQLVGVPLVIPLAWTWMAWPAWLAAGHLTPTPPTAGHLTPTPSTAGHLTPTPPTAARPAGAGRRAVAVRILVAGWALAAWDLFLDPQMVAEGYWRWADPRPHLPGITDVPVTNFLGWLAVAVLMMALLAVAIGPGTPWTDRSAASRDGGGRRRTDAPMIALYLWTYASSVLAGIAFLDLRGAAAWVAVGMGMVAVPLAVKVLRTHRPHRPAPVRSRPGAPGTGHQDAHGAGRPDPGGRLADAHDSTGTTGVMATGTPGTRGTAGHG